MLELTIRDPNSLLPVVFRRDITLEQLEAIKVLIDGKKSPLAELAEKRGLPIYTVKK